ncbi:MAG: hypothetical protein AAGJ11_17215, partial [Bacteroidota bacterium]
MDAISPSTDHAGDGAATEAPSPEALALLAAKGVDLDRLAQSYERLDEAAVARSYRAVEKS